MEKISMFTKVTLWVLMAVTIVLFVGLMVSIDDQTNPGVIAVRWITINLNWSIILLVFAAVIALGFASVQMLGDKKQAISALVVIGGFAVLLLVSYSLASSEIPNFLGAQKLVAENTLNATVSKWVGTGLFYTYILFAGAILSAVGFSVASVFKR